MLALSCYHGGTHAVVIEYRVAAIQGRAAVFKAVTDQARIVLFSGQLTAKVIVQIQYTATQTWPGEQFGLGRRVDLHRAVVVQMIARQVGQYRHIKRQRADPPLIQAVRGNLHCNRFGAGFFQVSQHGLHRNRVRRGVTTALQRTMKTGAQCADDAAVLPQQVKRLRHQLSHAGFTIGAGDAHQIELTARLAIKPPGDIGQLRRQPFDRNQRH